MTLPAVITVKATIEDGTGPVAGRITWTRNTSLLPEASVDDTYLIPEQITSTIGTDGVLEQPLFSCNDPAASPTGWTWTVTTHFPHWRATFDIVVPYNAAGGEVNLNQLAPVPPDEDGQLYALANHTHGGGGGGAVDSVFGRTGAVVAQNGDYVKSQVGLGNVDNTADASKTFGASQIISGTFDVARIPTGTSGTTVALGNAPAAAVSAHEAALDPHPRYVEVRYWDGDSYEIANSATIYVGPSDPGSVPDGSIWIDTDA